LPPNSVCTVDPPSANVANGTTVNLAVNIKTGQGTSAQSRRERMGWGLALAMVPCLILVFPAHSRKWASLFAATIIVLLIGLTCISCGGGSGNTSTGSGPATSGATPSGSYTVVVAAASTGKATQNIQLTVTVQ
jgi:hypothetical protein